jgi:hypothetical protein
VSSLREIEQAIERLSADEFAEIARWIHGRDQSRWDAQLDVDSASGRLDFLFEEAESEASAAGLEEWPPRP